MGFPVLSLPFDGGSTIHDSKNPQMKAATIQTYYFTHSYFHCATLFSAMANFNIGDVVQLKSGGPHMTVKSIEANGNVFCIWFDGSDTKQRGFPANTLQLAPKDDEPAFATDFTG